jgi:hypothetical protein
MFTKCSDFSPIFPVKTLPHVQHALALASVGLRVHPLEPRTKRPPRWLEKGWQSRATTDAAQILHWWDACPDANIGCVIDHYLVVDLDPRNDGLESLAQLEAQHGPLPPTWTVISGRGDGGTHRYYRLWSRVGDVPPATDIAHATRPTSPPAPSWWYPLTELLGLSDHQATRFWDACCASTHPAVRGLLFRCNQMSAHLRRHTWDDAYTLRDWLQTTWEPRVLVPTLEHLYTEHLLSRHECNQIQDQWLRRCDKEGKWLPSLRGEASPKNGA